MYYGSYRAPRTLVWAIGTVILILMMATAFLGNLNSPKWHINLGFISKNKARALSNKNNFKGKKPKHNRFYRSSRLNKS
jgi:hypothetical protein